MTFWQWFGLVLTIIFYYLFSMVGLKEGISFRSNKWVIYMTLSTIIGSISSLYDKYLVAHYNRLAMQAWYHVYMVPIMAIMLLLIWYPNRKKYDPFYWRWTIPMIGVCLTVGDFLYFWSLAYPGALIAIVSTIRRGSVIFSFSIGAVLFKEKNLKLKAIVLGGILLGIFIILLSNI